ncbi:sushi domain protein, partial [Teladorsagia circumcincta]
GTASQCLMTIAPVPSGTISYNNARPFGPWPLGSSASLTCNAGFTPSGPTTSTCSGNGQWLPSVLGPCLLSDSVTLAKCQAIPAILGGTVMYSDPRFPPFNQGTTATLVCSQGYTLAGSSSATCIGGVWTP